MKASTLKSGAAFTLVELMIGLVVLMLVGGVAYSILINATTLMAKNISLNASSTTLRAALDRVYTEVNQSNGLPTLVNADSSAAASVSGPAAGIIFDRYVSGPYIVTNPGSSGLSSTATSFVMKCSTDPLASPAAPKTNDVVSMDAGNTRPLVQSCASSTSGSLQTLTVQLQGPIGKDIPWDTSVQKIAYLIHHEAIIVALANGRAELRFYGNAEALNTSNCNDVSTYTVLTRDIGTATGEATPFSYVTQGSTSFLNIAMRVEDRQFNAYLASRQAKEFNTFLRVDTMLRPRNFL
jgi:type II secretory pathway pseudopilin PulG